MTVSTNRLLAATAALAATVATIGFASPGHAQTLAATVRYGDLDPASERGARMLDRRIHRAARKVCGGDGRATMPDVARCRSVAIAGARNDLRIALAGSGGTRLAAK